MGAYILKQGDYLSQIAARAGLAPRDVWDHPRNAELRARRANPEALAPGDMLWVPDAPQPPLRLRPGVPNRYKASPARVSVRLRLRDHDGPLAGLRCIVRGVAAAPLEAATDADGELRFEAPVHAREAEIEVPERRATLVARIGHLDPLEAPSGVRQRLANLGFHPFGHGGVDEHVMAQVDRAALAAFQHAAALPETGTADDATRACLRERYGS